MLGALRHPQLLAYLAGNLFSIVGTWGQRVAVFWLAWELTGSTSVLGVLATLELLPSVLAAPIAGAMADSRPALKLTRNVQALSILPPLLMITASAFGEITLPLLMLLSLVTGVLNGMDHPLRLLLVGSIAPRDQVAGAVAINSVVFNVARMIGPAIGGWAISANITEAVFAYNALSFLLFAAVLTVLKIPNGQGRTNPGGGSAAGLRGWLDVYYAFDRSLLLLFSLFAAIALIIRPIFELLPSFAEDLTQTSLKAPQVFSLLTSAQGMGAMIGAIAASLLLTRLQYRASAFVAGAASVVAALVFLGVSQFTFALVALATISGAVLANGISTQVALQTQLPDLVKGRSLALYTVTFRGLPAIGALLVGALGEIASLRSVFVILIALMLGSGLWLRCVKR